ncbi:MAG: hypothetical protein KF881_11790 [Acidobacteria bacterium]|nr:hypothetical protein [Acidobacteriota bacterium]
MDAQKLHLILNHYPAILMVAATVLLAFGMFRASDGVVKFGLYFAVAAGLIALPAFVTGEMSGAKAIYSGPHAEALAAHKHTARTSFFLIEAAGIASLIAVFRLRLGRKPGKVFAAAILAVSVVACVMMVYTTHLGRQVKWAAAENADLIENTKENKQWHA